MRLWCFKPAASISLSEYMKISCNIQVISNNISMIIDMKLKIIFSFSQVRDNGMEGIPVYFIILYILGCW